MTKAEKTRALIGALILLLLLALWLLDRTGVVRLSPRRPSPCIANLKFIGRVALMYTQDHRHAFPPNLQSLFDSEHIPREFRNSMFTCPSTTGKPGDPTRVDEWSGYKYRVPGKTLMSLPNPSSVPIAYDRRLSHHGGRGANVLFADAHVEFLLVEDLRRLKTKYPGFHVEE